jgi:hypothetical protein
MIDLDTQLRELFKKEDMYAFFDFILPCGIGLTTSGLCKISKPKGDQRKTSYFSLLFLIDSPSEAAWNYIHAEFQRIPWNFLSDRLSGVDAVLAIPYPQSTHGLCFKEIDIYLKEGTLLSRTFLENILIPAVVGQMGCQAGETVFWEDLPAKPAKPSQSTIKTPASQLPLVDRVWEWMGI